MEAKIMHKVLQVEGMTCSSCEIRIENKLKKMEGVVEAKAMFSSSNVYVTYDANVVELAAVIEAVEELEYKVRNNPAGHSTESPVELKKEQGEVLPINQLIGIGIIIFALYVIVKNTIGFNFIPQVDQSMGYGILFVVGAITSLHCIAMCGGLNLSQCVSYQPAVGGGSKFSKLKPSLMYNAGRVISYTVVGGIVGGIGSAVSFSGAAKGIVAILSGAFMVIMGLNMLNVFPWLRKLNPRMPKIFGRKIHSLNGRHGPLYVGLLNGLMPCGPLQAMQIYALGTGSVAAGALSMMLFSLGTVPLMFGFGAISSFLSSKFTGRMMKVSALLVMFLGIIMVSRGLSLSGISMAYASPAKTGNIAEVQGEVQAVITKLESGRYAPIVVQKGIPVKWKIKAEKADLNGCNNMITIPEYRIENKRLFPGDNVIEFTPDKEGTFVYSCWMGMITSSIKVVEDISGVSAKDLEETEASEPQYPAGVSGGCCADGSKAARFLDGKVPTDEVYIAKVENGQQEVTITVNDEGYTPAAAVVQKGVKVKIKFTTEKLNNCNNAVVFPEYQGQLDLSKQNETPWLTPEADFTFQCWMGMLHGYIKVVDDVNNINLDEIKQEIRNYTPAAGGAGGGGCCGG